MKINLFKTGVLYGYKQPLMMMFVVLSSWLITLAPVNAQAILGQRLLGSSNAEVITNTSDGNYMVAGTSGSDVSGHHGLSDMFVTKLSQSGYILWRKVIGGSIWETLQGIVPTVDGGCIVAGGTGSQDGDVRGNHGKFDVWIVRLDQAGTIVWAKTYGGSGDDEAWDIKATPDGNFIVVGITQSKDGDVTSPGNGLQDAWVLKLSGNGDLLWQRTLGCSGGAGARGVSLTADGGYVLAGFASANDGDVTGNHGGNDFWIVRLSSSGSIVWQKSLGGGNQEYPNAITPTPDGGFVVTGPTNSTDGQVTGNHGGYWDMWVVKVTGSGDLVWQKTLGGSGEEEARDVTVTADGGYLVCGYTTSADGDVTNFHGEYDGWVVKLSGAGEKVWQKTLGGSKRDNINGVTLNQQGQFLLAGSTSSTDGDLALATSELPRNEFGNGWVVLLAEEPLKLLSPTYNCQTGAITFNISGNSEFLPLYLAAPGVTLSSPTSTSGIVDAKLRANPRPIVIKVRQGTQTAAYIFDLEAACPSAADRLILLPPSYACETGAIHFNTKGGDGSSIEFRAVGITDWTTNPDQVVDQESRKSSDKQLFHLYARQNDVVATLTWDIQATCRRARRAVSESGSDLKVQVLGNPIVNHTVEFEVSGITGEEVEVRILTASGQLVQQKVVSAVGDRERVRLEVDCEPGEFLVEVVAGEQRKIVKLIKL